MTVIDRPQKPLLGKVRMTSEMVVDTGLHIGGGGENLDIGGLDKPVIRDPITRHPYLPGSSIKGKLRSILERFLEKPLNRKGSRDTFRYESDDLADGFTEISRGQFIAFEGAKHCPVSRLFGSTGVNCWILSTVANDEQLEKLSDASGVLKRGLTHPKLETEAEYTKVKGRNSPARLIVRDCHLHPTSIKELEDLDTGLYMTEWKFENGLDRITAAANPRQIERVPAGSRFNFELVYTVENEAQAVEDLKHLAIALAILEDDALGGHGSRGYGKVRFEKFQFFYRGIEQYKQVGTAGANLLEPFKELDNTAALLSEFGTLSSEIQTRLLPGDSNAE